MTFIIMTRKYYIHLCIGFMAVLFMGSCQSNSTQVNKHDKSTAIDGVVFETPAISKQSTVFFLANDLGRNGYYEQKKVAELMGIMAKEVGPDFVVAAGDTHHFDGVASVTDPLWMTNYELIYSHPELMIDWFAINGNHEYRGNTQAILDYTDISRRWNAPDYYYTKTIEAGDKTAQLFFIDTTPLIDKYRKEAEAYPDASKQDKDDQLRWLEKELANSAAYWKIVIGHHPVYAYTTKNESERTDLQSCLVPLFEKYKVDSYLCGHIHNFQHIKPDNSHVDYLVNSSGSLSRKVQEIDGTQFCSGEAGFTIVSVDGNYLTLNLVNSEGKIIYTYNRVK